MDVEIVSTLGIDEKMLQCDRLRSCLTEAITHNEDDYSEDESVPDTLTALKDELGELLPFCTDLLDSGVKAILAIDGGNPMRFTVKAIADIISMQRTSEPRIAIKSINSSIRGGALKGACLVDVWGVEEEVGFSGFIALRSTEGTLLLPDGLWLHFESETSALYRVGVYNDAIRSKIIKAIP